MEENKKSYCDEAIEKLLEEKRELCKEHLDIDKHNRIINYRINNPTSIVSFTEKLKQAFFYVLYFLIGFLNLLFCIILLKIFFNCCKEIFFKIIGLS